MFYTSSHFPKKRLKRRNQSNYLVKEFLWANFKCSSPSLRHTMPILLGKFLCRLRDFTHAEKRRAHPSKRNKAEAVVVSATPATSQNIAQDMVKWMVSFLLGAFYPGAPLQRKMTALHVYKQILVTLPTTGRMNLCDVGAFSPEVVSAMMIGLWDDIDGVRLLVSEVLRLLPAPLPTLADPEVVQGIANWGTHMLHSPRAREADSGALVMRVVLEKYVLSGTHIIHIESKAPFVKVDSLAHTPEAKQFTNTIVYMRGMLGLLEHHISVMSADLVLASRSTPLHGPLLAIRYIFEAMNFDSIYDKEEISAWKSFATDLLDVVDKLAFLILPVISSSTPEGLTDATSFPSGQDQEADDSLEESGLGQYVAVMAWLSVKEIALLLAALIHNLPLPSPFNDRAIVDEACVERAGALYLHILLSARHRGALEKSYLGFQVLCEKLLKSEHPFIHRLAVGWLDRLLHTIREDAISSVSRRSAGLPYAFTAILRAEAAIAHQQRSDATLLVEKAITTLLAMAAGHATESAVLAGLELKTVDTETGNEVPHGDNREGGVQARKEAMAVHALNVMRMLFRDSLLRTALNPYVPQVLAITLHGYSSPIWAIRNSCTMTFSVVVERAVAPKLNRNEQSKKNSVTFAQFFGAFPALYPILLAALRQAVGQLPQGGEEASKSTASHTNLYPILVILSKLRASLAKEQSPKALESLKEAAGTSNDQPEEQFVTNSTRNYDSSHSPQEFAPLVLLCGYHRVYKVREMAANAVVPLISNNNVVDTLKTLCHDALAYLVRPVTNYNRVHGCLLQIRCLLASALHSTKLREAVIACVSEWIAKRAEASSEKNPACGLDLLRISCGPVQQTTAQILGLIFPHSEDLARAALPTVLEVLLTTRTQRGHQIMVTGLRKELAKLCFSTYRTTKSSEEINHLITGCLLDPDYEVRIACKKFLHALIRDSNGLSISWDIVQKLVLAGLQDGSESYPASLKHSVRLLRTMPTCVPLATLLFGSAKNEFREQSSATSEPLLWARLRNLLAQPSLASLKEQVLSFMGLYLAQILEDKSSTNEPYFEAMLRYYLRQCEEYADPEQTVDYRLAVARSLRVSGLCLCTPARAQGTAAHHTVQTSQLLLVTAAMNAWRIIVQLVEDDEEAVRREASALIASCSQSTESFATRSLVAPAAFEVAFTHLTRHYSDSPLYLHMLFSFLRLEPSVPLSTHQQQPQHHTPHGFEFLSTSWGDYGVALFEKEADNWYQEKVLLIQATCRELRHIIPLHLGQQHTTQHTPQPQSPTHTTQPSIVSITDTNTPLAESIPAYQAFYAARLCALFRWLLQQQNDKSVAWGAWLTYQRDVFMRAYETISHLQLLMDVLPPAGAGDSTESGFTSELGTLAAQLAHLHPLLSHALHFLLPVPQPLLTPSNTSHARPPAALPLLGNTFLLRQEI
eukprot:TRINITY_DN6969_c0_g1_i2.p1 TRINITY_DN6969_c0_g1~~TRINITY_DN6969_c0_g1_i2.p1  ORF type:complete len:1429 (+),score=218.47 TRINITY_DN6969_c0_g1_i2:1373-5659(+)